MDEQVDIVLDDHDKKQVPLPHNYDSSDHNHRGKKDSSTPEPEGQLEKRQQFDVKKKFKEDFQNTGLPITRSSVGGKPPHSLQIPLKKQQNGCNSSD